MEGSSGTGEKISPEKTGLIEGGKINSKTGGPNFYAVNV